MPLDPAQRHQIEQDAVTTVWKAERLAACVRRRMIWNRRPNFGAKGSGSSVSGYAAWR